MRLIITASGGGYLATPDAVIIPQQSWNGRGADVDSIDRPLRALQALQAKNGTGVAISTATPTGFLTPNFGERPTQAPRTHSLDAPVPTITSHGAVMFVSPDLGQIGELELGKPYVIVSGNVIQLDILYRMLANSELSRAMSLDTDDETFRFHPSASTSDQTRMIGNGIAVLTAKAIIGNALSYRFQSEKSLDIAS